MIKYGGTQKLFIPVNFSIVSYKQEMCKSFLQKTANETF